MVNHLSHEDSCPRQGNHEESLISLPFPEDICPTWPSPVGEENRNHSLRFSLAAKGAQPRRERKGYDSAQILPNEHLAFSFVKLKTDN